MASFFTMDFSGGMNEVIDPALLEKNTAALLVNADILDGKISSIKLPAWYADKPEDLRHYGRLDRSVVKLYERTYWSNNEAETAPFYGGAEENYLGIPYPDYSTDVKIEKVSGELDGNHKYCVTFVNANGWESAPGSITDYEKTVSLEKQTAKITVSWNSDKVSYAKIYRTQKEGADFFCVGEVKKSGEAFTDNIDDYTIAGLEPLSSIDNYPPPERGRYLCESGNVFFLAVGSKLYFSVPGNPHAWPILNYIGVDDVITGIVPEFQGVLVFTANNTYRITGAEDVQTLTKSMIPGNQGCVKYQTVAQVSNYPIWLSNDGICMWNGESISIISQQVMDTYKLQPRFAVSANDSYYLFKEEGAIVFDLRNGGKFHKLDFTCDYAWYDADADNFYLQFNEKGIYLWGTGEKAVYSYLSPYIGVPESAHTRFREILLIIDGNATVSIYDEYRQICTAVLGKSGQHRIKLPYNILCRYIQIKVDGIGSLREAGVIYI